MCIFFFYFIGAYAINILTGIEYTYPVTIEDGRESLERRRATIVFRN